MTERLIPGVFADIGLDLSGAVWIAYETPARDAIILLRDGVKQDRIAGPEALFPALSAEGPVVAVACQIGPTVAVRIAGTTYQYPHLGPVYGNYPVRLTWVGTRWVLAAITRPGSSLVILTRSSLTPDGLLLQETTEAVNTSQGIFSLSPTGAIVLTDDAPRVPGALKLWTVGGLTVGEGYQPDDHLWGRDASGVIRIADGIAWEPRHVQRADGSYVIVARSPQGVRLIEGPPWPGTAPDPLPPFVPAKVKRYVPWAWFDPLASTPGNHRIADLTEIGPDTRYVFAVGQPESSRRALKAAVAETRRAIAAAGVVAEIVTYSSGKNFVIGGTIPGFELYFRPGESVRELLRRFRVWAKPLRRYAMIVQGYDRNGTQADRLADIIQLQAEAAKHASRNRRCRLVWCYSWDRLGGAKDYPALQAAARAQFAEIP